MAELDRAGISMRMGQSRQAVGLTQPEIADMLDVHFRAVQNWESPKIRSVPFDRLDEWSKLTHVSREWLLYGEETQPEALTEIRDEISALRQAQVEELATVMEQLSIVRELQTMAQGLALLPSLLEQLQALVDELRAAPRRRGASGSSRSTKR